MIEKRRVTESADGKYFEFFNCHREAIASQTSNIEESAQDLKWFSVPYWYEVPYVKRSWLSHFFNNIFELFNAYSALCFFIL